MKMDFNGKRVLVTGGTRDIGRSIVEGFLGAGARLALHGSSPDSVNKAAAEIQGSAPVVKVASSLATVEGCRLAVEAPYRPQISAISSSGARSPSMENTDSVTTKMRPPSSRAEANRRSRSPQSLCKKLFAFANDSRIPSLIEAWLNPSYNTVSPRRGTQLNNPTFASYPEL